MSTESTLRKATVKTLAETLNELRTRAVDVVAPASAISARGGALVISGVEPQLTDEGVTTADGLYAPTGIALEGIASKLDIPLAYLRRTREVAAQPWTPDQAEFGASLFDVNVNTWLREAGDKRFLLRLLTSDGPGEDGYDGVLRAVLSDSYRTIDNFDVLLAVLNGLRASGIKNPKIEADLTDRRMYVRVTAPEVAVQGRSLVKNYRSPYKRNEDGTPMTGEQLPLVWAGFVVANSETGGGAFSITPRAEFQVCDNGMTIKADAFREIHLGGKLDAGVIKWSDATLAKNLALVTSQTTDAVAQFLTPEYWDAKVIEAEKAAGVEITDAPATIAHVSKRLGFTEDEATNILNAFIDGGLRTAGGVMQAVTAHAQNIEDADAAWDLESAGLSALELAAAFTPTAK